MNDIFTPNFRPQNHTELVLWTLAQHANSGFELSCSTWITQHRIAKFSTRLGEVEKQTGKELVKREWKKFVNVFGLKDQYRIYIPLFSCSEYTEMFLKLREKESK